MARPKKVQEVEPAFTEAPEVATKAPETPPVEKKTLVETVAVKSTKELNKEKLQRFIDAETKTVKGRFRMLETPGGNQRIQVRKYPRIPMFDKVMKDGEMYEIPLYVARFLNGIDATAEAVGGKIGTCSYPVHGFKWNPLEAMPNPAPGSEQGIPVPVAGITKRVRRYAFESAEFEIHT